MANRSGLRLGGATRSAAFFFLLRGTVALTLGRLFSVPNGTLVVGEGDHELLRAASRCTHWNWTGRYRILGRRPYSCRVRRRVVDFIEYLNFRGFTAEPWCSAVRRRGRCQATSNGLSFAFEDEASKKDQGVAQALAPGPRIAKGRGALRDP